MPRRRRGARRGPGRSRRRPPSSAGPPRTSGRGGPSGSRRGTSAGAARPRTRGGGTTAAGYRSSTGRRSSGPGPRGGFGPLPRSRRCLRAGGIPPATRQRPARQGRSGRRARPTGRFRGGSWCCSGRRSGGGHRAARVSGADADRVDGGTRLAAGSRDPDESRADPARPRLAREDRSQRRDRVVALDDQPLDAVGVARPPRSCRGDRSASRLRRDPCGSDSPPRRST